MDIQLEIFFIVLFIFVIRIITKIRHDVSNKEQIHYRLNKKYKDNSNNTVYCDLGSHSSSSNSYSDGGSSSSSSDGGGGC